jgi:putative peptidoglycan lipid II flippase
MQDPRTPALVNVAAAVVNVVADGVFVLVFGWGVPGLALGHALSYAFGTVSLTWILRTRIGSLDGRRVGSTLARTIPTAVVTALAAAGAAAAVRAVVDDASKLEDLLEVVIGVGVGVLVFLGCALIFGIREVDDVVSALSRRLRR